MFRFLPGKFDEELKNWKRFLELEYLKITRYGYKLRYDYKVSQKRTKFG